MQTTVEEIVKNLKNEPRKYVGAKQFVRAARNEDVNYVVLAADADFDMKSRIIDECHRKKITLYETPKKALLGEACGIDVSAAIVTVIKV